MFRCFEVDLTRRVCITRCVDFIKRMEEIQIRTDFLDTIKTLNIEHILLSMVDDLFSKVHVYVAQSVVNVTYLRELIKTFLFLF